MYELALFAGGGGGILGAKLLGWRTICAVEIDSDARRVLLNRQRDKMLPQFPIWDDVCTFDGRGWQGQIDVVTAGFPCQGTSLAGKAKGLEDERSGLWVHAARVIDETKAPFVLIENSIGLRGRGLHKVLSDLAALGFDAEWGCFSACAFGAPHMRRRLFLLAYAHGDNGKERLRSWETFSKPLPFECSEALRQDWLGSVARNARGGAGVAGRVDRTRILGNGQVPRMAASAWQALLQRATND